jgi:2-methylcitrate dehydratase PrpD
MPARDGVTAASLVQAGWTGVEDVFSGPDNFFMAHAPKGDPAKLVEGLGERYEVMRTDIKKWTVGSPIQAPLDALHGLIEAHGLKADQVREVVVRLAPTVGAVVDNREMPDVSLQHMVAVMLLDGTASFQAAHDRARMKDAAVLAEKAKVRLVADPALAARLPLRVAVVELTLVDGRRLENRVETVRGTAANPMSPDEVVDKARDLLAPTLGRALTERLIAATLGIEKVDALADLARLLQPA